MTNVPLNSIGLPETVWFSEGRLSLLDQTQLPHRIVAAHPITVEDVVQSIATMQVRGAPAIGVAAAYGMIVDRDDLLSQTDMDIALAGRAERLIAARPTAVNLAWAVRELLGVAESCKDLEPLVRYQTMLAAAKKIHAGDREMCRRIGEHGKRLIQVGDGVLTHCNAGSLATSEHGTATSPLYAAHRAGLRFRAYADETRPRLQGAMLTAWELQQSGIDTTLICDNMAASLMAAGNIQLVIVGTDRVAANGDVANKIGTLPLAIVANHYRVPFYVALPSSTLDMATPTGDTIEIEQRGDDEITHVAGHRIAPENVKVINLAFDVTPAALVTGYITEHGISKTPAARG